MLQVQERAINVNQGLKSVSAIKRYPRTKKRGGENVQWHRIKDHQAELQRALRFSPEIGDTISRLVLFKHITAFEGEAARRYAYIMARFEKYHVDTRRNMRSPSYERAFGTDQELERIAGIPDGLDTYERRARKALRHYEKLMKLLVPYGATAKALLDDMCCSDIEPPAQYRDNLAMVLRSVGKAFGVMAPARKNGRR